MLECRNLLRHGADDGQAAKDANGGPKNHGNVAQRTCHGGVGAVPEKVRYGMRKPGEDGRRQDRVEDAVDVDVPSKRTSHLRFRCCRCDMRTHVGIGEGRCKVGVGPSRGKVESRRMEARWKEKSKRWRSAASGRKKVGMRCLGTVTASWLCSFAPRCPGSGFCGSGKQTPRFRFR